MDVEPNEAEATLRRARDLWHQAQPDDHASATSIEGALARDRLAQGLKREALATSDWALEMARRYTGEESLLTASLLADRALILKSLKRRKQARLCKKAAAGIRQSLGGDEGRQTVHIQSLRSR